MKLKDRLDQAYGGKKGTDGSRVPGTGGESGSGKATGDRRSYPPAKGQAPASTAKPAATAPISANAGPRSAGGLVKETGAERGYRKVAKFLLLLGQEEAARVLKHMNLEEMEGIVREISTIKKIESVEAQAILAEFGALIKSGGAVQGGGSDAARDILVQAFGEEKGGEFLRRALPEENKPFPYLRELDAEQILLVLKGESSQVLAVVLPQLDPKTASELIIRLEEGLRTEVVRRMAKLEKIKPEVLASMDAALARKVVKLDRSDSETVDGGKALAGILRHLGPELEESILVSLEEDDPGLAASIRDRLFTLEDVLRVRAIDLQRELRGMGDKEIAMLLKGKSEAFKEKILRAVSKERRAMVMEEHEILGSVRRQDAEEQTRDFIMSLKRRYEDGDLVLEGDDDLLV